MFVIWLKAGYSSKVCYRQVSTEEGRALAQKWGCAFVETSAKHNENICAFCFIIIGLLTLDLRHNFYSSRNFHFANSRNTEGCSSGGTKTKRLCAIIARVVDGGFSTVHCAHL